jgi:hypothetical protein
MQCSRKESYVPEKAVAQNRCAENIATSENNSEKLREREGVTYAQESEDGKRLGQRHRGSGSQNYGI